MRISIIVPTYNESENLEELFRRISSAIKEDYEIIVVDDDSPDGTWKKAEELSSRFPVRVLRRTEEKGLSSAVIRGFEIAKGDVFVVMDADLQHPPEVIPSLIKAIEGGADIAIASRYVEGGKVENWYWWRKLISRGAIMVGRVALPKIRNIKDPVSGFFALKREVVDGASLNPVGFKILLEVLIKGKYRKVVEVPFTFGLRNAGESKLGQKQIINYLRHVYRLMRWEGELDRLVKFSMVGITGIVVNEGALYILVESGALSENTAVFPATELSILNNFVWNDLWTFRDLKRGSFIKRLLNFHVAAVGGFVVQVAVYFALKSVGVPYLVANFVGILLSFVVRFLFNRHVTWG